MKINRKNHNCKKTPYEKLSWGDCFIDYDDCVCIKCNSKEYFIVDGGAKVNRKNSEDIESLVTPLPNAVLYTNEEEK